MFLHLSVILSTGGACMVALGGRAWLLWGGMHGCSGEGACVVALGGTCVVALGGHAWLLWGGWGGACMVALGGCMHGCSGACMVALGGHVWLLWGGMCGCSGGHAWFLLGGHVWFFPGVGGGMCRIRRDTVNERAERILLECILV